MSIDSSKPGSTACLVVPSIEYKDSFLEAVSEFQAEGRYKQDDMLELEKDFRQFVEDLLSRVSRSEARPGLVPETILWLVDNGEYIGKVAIKHELNEGLFRLGGNIGYDIRPSQRMNGYGKYMLKLALPKARELGLERILVDCMCNNIGSRKIIEANGGVFEKETEVERPEGTVRMRRYWIEIPEDNK